MRRRAALISTVGALVALASVAVAQARPEAQGGTINIAWIGDKSGPTVVAQAPIVHAQEAYWRMVNDAGGINGRRINFIQKDDGYSPARMLEYTKSVINDDKVVLVTGIGQSSGLASILPVLSQAKVAGFINQATLKEMSDPFQPWIFEGNCNYSDQVDVSLGYQMTRLKRKNLRGVKVGVAGIEVASGQEWIAIVKDRVGKLGGSTVSVTLPSAIVNADVQVQTLQNEKVAFILMHHAATGGIAMLKSMAKYNFDVPVSGSFGVTNEVVFTNSPYEASKNFFGTNCVTPPALAKSPKGRQAISTAQKYGYPASEYNQMNWSLGWAHAMVIHEALKKVRGGNYTGETVRNAIRTMANFDTGGLSPNIKFSPKCHMGIREVRPYTYNYKLKTIQPVGSYQQWSKWVTNGYAAKGTCGKK
jgi:branched-chain amino acid transport system substrate-binding protein